MDKTGMDRTESPMECATPGTVENRLAKLEKREQQVRKAIKDVLGLMGLPDKTGPLARRVMQDLEAFLDQ